MVWCALGVAERPKSASPAARLSAASTDVGDGPPAAGEAFDGRSTSSDVEGRALSKSSALSAACGTLPAPVVAPGRSHHHPGDYDPRDRVLRSTASPQVAVDARVPMVVEIAAAFNRASVCH